MDGDDQSPKSPPRRRRPPLSCTICRRRKLKCDRALPCGQCVKSKTPGQCVYVGPQAPTSGRAGSTPPDRARVSSSRASPAHGGLYVFDSKHQSTNRVSKPKSRSDELHELRNRIQFLESALSKTGPIHTPESLGYDAPSEGGHRMGPEAHNLVDSVKDLPDRCCFRGKKSRTRYVGRSHSSVSLSFFDDVGTFMRGRRSTLKRNPDYKKFKDFKGELWSRERQEHQRAFRDKPPTLEEMVPPRHVADELLNLYLTTFETTHRILHIPTFLEQYENFWAGLQPREPSFVAKLLALMAASCCFLSPTTKINGEGPVYQTAAEWIAGVRSWIASTLVSSTIDFNILQIECLLMIARQADAIDGDIVWISSGSLTRTAMTMGLHRDPHRFGKMTKFWAEMRRRLWATILELDLQSSLDGGMPPTIDLDEYDCEPPSNLDDSQLTEDMTEDPDPKDPGVLTQSTFQVLLLQSLPLRLHIAKAINSLKFTLSYDEALRLSEELIQFMHQGVGTFQKSELGLPSPGGNDSSFAQSMLVFLLRRSILVVNRPFALSILRSPKFSYSRKICLESALEILSHHEPPASAQVCPHLGQLSGGMFRDEFLHAALTVCVELYLQAGEFNRTSASTAGQSSALTSLNDLVRSQQEVMVGAVERTIETFGSRITPNGKGSKAFFLPNLALSSVKARLRGEDPQKVIELDAMKCMQACEQVMRGATWASVRARQAESTPVSTPSLSLATPDLPFDPASFGLDTSLDFGTMFDMNDYGMPGMWDQDFLTLF
ncbi:C6 transcription factor [Aspergillus sclerotioniger CBS 115572]|uniref:C6 transcription factor n=1 Tax=Aspergillus sclerotioniger CBS 115572 TaxID=1450535 RepID=A0A317UUG2_9EURO|nr:C6 transcription factor [Aspergillus sclerotioniger CBS 115572]PWY65009.1 C6 transcription factor [Aspergillus sclerotioniger CBS 115572]